MDEKVIQKYTDPSNPGAFSGLSGFKKNNKNLKNVKNTLLSIPSYTLHKPIRKIYKTNRVVVYSIDEQWQVDLVDVTNISSSNNNYKFIMTVIDSFSKYAWAIPLVNKSSSNTKAAFQKIFDISNRIPKIIYSDAGNEFKGECLSFLKSKGIKIYISQSKYKASIVERFNRTLKEKMYRYFTLQKDNKELVGFHKKRFLNILPQLVENYNNSYHRSIKMKPTQVSSKNEAQVFNNLYSNIEDIKFKFKVGDYVRHVKLKGKFEKGYTPSWSEKIFIIKKVAVNFPPL